MIYIHHYIFFEKIININLFKFNLILKINSMNTFQYRMKYIVNNNFYL